MAEKLAQILAQKNSYWNYLDIWIYNNLRKIERKVHLPNVTNINWIFELMYGIPNKELNYSFPLHILDWTPNIHDKCIIKKSFRQAYGILFNQLFETLLSAQFSLSRIIRALNSLDIDIQHLDIDLQKYELEVVKATNLPLFWFVLNVVNYDLKIKRQSLQIVASEKSEN